MVGKDRSLVDTSRKRQKKWMGHISQVNSLLRTVLQGRMESKRGRRHRRMMLMDDTIV